MTPFQKFVFHDKYFGYLHKINTTVFTTLFDIKQVKLHYSSPIHIKLSLYGYVIFFRSHTLLAVGIIWKINNITKLANSANNGDRKVKISSLDSGEDWEYSGIDFVVIYKIFVMQNAFCLEAESFDRILVMKTVTSILQIFFIFTGLIFGLTALFILALNHTATWLLRKSRNFCNKPCPCNLRTFPCSFPIS